MRIHLYSLFLSVVFLSFASQKIQAQSSPSDYFRSIGSGLWSAAATWQSSTSSSGPFVTATLAPTSASSGITIRRGDVVTLNDTRLIDQVNVIGTLMVNPNIYVELNDGPGTDLIINAGGQLILKSDATGSAGIDNLEKYSAAGETATIEQHNNVVQQRYFNAIRSWRLITAPLSSSAGDVSIYQTWQNNGVYAAGKGTFVTAPTGTAAEGIDANRGYSVKSFDVSTQALVNVGNTITTPLITSPSHGFYNYGHGNMSYFVFVRGDRNPSNLTIPNKNTTTLSATGELQTGSQSFSPSSNPGEFTLIGNPYAALVDFSLVAKYGVLDRFYAFDPTLGETGAYTVVDRPAGQTLYSVSVPSSQQTSIIQINQAVFVQSGPDASGESSVVFSESSKTTIGNTTGVFRTEHSKLPSFTSNLYGVYADNSIKLFDGNEVDFGKSYSAKVDSKEDAPKMSNFNENFGLVRDGSTLAIERRAPITSNDTVFLKLWNTTVRKYQLQFIAANFAPEVSAYLEDAYLKTSTALDLSAPSNISFEVTSNAASADPNRFRVVFKVAHPITVTDDSKGDISVYPNPVKGKMLNLRLMNLPKGQYYVRLFNSSGQQVYSKSIQHIGGTFTQTLHLNSGIAKGVYQLQVNDGKNKIQKQVVCD